MTLARGNALALPLASGSVDLIVTSPPYFALRSYTDGGEHYDGQIGSEATPAEFIAALVEVTRECVRVLKPSGSIWVNLGDKYSNRVATRTSSHQDGLFPGRDDLDKDWKRDKALGLARMPADNILNGQPIREKSLMGLPWRYAIGCIDQLGLILRANVIWAKPNGLPESVTDRVRRSHEDWFHFTKEPRYYSAVDEIREAHEDTFHADRRGKGQTSWKSGTKGDVHGQNRTDGWGVKLYNPLGKLPGSVWTVPTEPLRVPDHLPQHFAAFPSEWPKRIILGWSPSGICVECGEGRRPVVDRELQVDHVQRRTRGRQDLNDDGSGRTAESSFGITDRSVVGSYSTTITGESCACPTPDAPTRPAVVLDPFCGTGTTVAVANALGRHGVGIDLSADYLKVARWRCQDPKLRAKVLRVDPPPTQVAGQLDLLGGAA